MSKRFVDTEIWNKSWYQELSLKEKILVKFIFEQCDCAGVWDINFRLASFIIGETVSFTDIEEINKKNLLFEVFDNDKLFVIDFIKFQYGTLSENCKPHKPIIEKLKKYNLYERVSKGYSKGYPKGIHTLEEKEKEKEQLIEKEKVKEKEDKYNNKYINLIKKEFKKVFGKSGMLTADNLNKISELAENNPDFMETIPETIKKLKRVDMSEIGYNAKTLCWLFEKDHYEKVYSGAWDYETREEIVARLEQAEMEQRRKKQNEKH